MVSYASYGFSISEASFFHESAWRMNESQRFDEVET
jgi:hypothetical protein